MTAIDELCRLLDERGVPWRCYGYENHTWWGEWHAENRPSVNGLFLKVEGVVTPEQAIEATLERGTCRDTGESRWFRCSKCGFGFSDWYLDDESDSDEQPRYCPNCGRKVVTS